MQVGTYSIVNGKGSVIENLTGLSLNDAENALCRQINLGADAFISDDEPNDLQQAMNNSLSANPELIKVIASYKAKRWSSLEVKSVIRIAFCQPKYYTPTAWRRSKTLMDTLVCPLGLAFPHDYGRGKGKYSTNFDIDEVTKEIQRLISPFG